jgi:hypothetical protein
MHDGLVDPAGELLPHPVGGDALEAVDQPGDGDLARIEHQQVDVLAFAVELLQLRLEFLADLAHDVFAACQHLALAHLTSVLRHKDQTHMHRRNALSTASVVVPSIHRPIAAGS